MGTSCAVGADPSHLAPNIFSIRIGIRKRSLHPDGFWNVAKSPTHSLAENWSAEVAMATGIRRLDVGHLSRSQWALPGLIVVCFGRFLVMVSRSQMRGCQVPGHPFHWKNTLPWHLGPAAKVRILRFKNLPPFRHDRGLQNHV
jgi:hypothetical protein